MQTLLKVLVIVAIACCFLLLALMAGAGVLNCGIAGVLTVLVSALYLTY